MLILVFGLVYLGMLQGGIPGSNVDRTGVARLGAILMIVLGGVTPDGPSRTSTSPRSRSCSACSAWWAGRGWCFSPTTSS